MTGEAGLGILLLDTAFPRIPGDVGNPASYSYPVLLKTVPGATVRRVVFESDPDLLQSFIKAAQELEAQGAAAITSSCGFLSVFQKAVAQAVNVPVFLSSLLQVPLAYALTQQRVAVITAHSGRLIQPVLTCAGINEELPFVVRGLEDVTAFSDPILKDGNDLQRDAIQGEIITIVSRLLEEYPDIGSFVFECHNLAPYSQQVVQTTGRPVFDIIDFANFIYSTLGKRSYPDLSPLEK